MNKLLIGATMGMMAGVALMMSPMGKDISRSMCKARKMARKMM